MSELERELRDLGAALAFPETPDLAAPVRRGLAPQREGSPWRRLALGAALVLVALLAGLALPQARTAILRFFGVGAVRIEIVDRLPAVRLAPAIDQNTQITAAEAPFRILRSGLLGTPDGIYSELGVVTLVYGSTSRARLLVTEIAGTPLEPQTIKKLLTVSTEVEPVTVPGATDQALWISGRPHAVHLPGAPPRIAGNTLIWQAGGLTLRLEGKLSREDAVRIAASFG
jgi:hypothetical protein